MKRDSIAWGLAADSIRAASAFSQWRARRHQLRTCLLVGLLATAAAAPALAQSVGNHGEIAEAERLRDVRRFSDAITVLRRHLATHPDDTAATRLLAETLYWNGEVDAARAAYTQAEQRHPADMLLRLQHARLLVDLNEQAAATSRLQHLRTLETTAGEAEALLGTLARFRGDLTAARAHWLAALRLKPGHAAAQRGVTEIRAASSPWVQTRFRFYDDDQPLTRATVAASAGAYLTPLHALLVETEADHFSTGSAGTGGAMLGVFRGYWPGPRLETEFAGGFRTGVPVDGTAWLGRAVVGFRLTTQVTASFAMEREPYLETFASTLQPVIVNKTTGQLDWQTSTGWLGQFRARRLWYPDANTGVAVSGWALAPIVVRRDGPHVRVGYAFGWNDTRESRFEPILPAAGAAGGGIEGFYLPYFTPIEAQAHSLAASVSIPASPRVTLHVNASYPVFARETADFFYYDAGETPGTLVVRQGRYRRAHTPVQIRGAVDAPVHRELSLQVELEHMRGSFWRGTRITTGLLYRFQATTR